MSSDDPTLKQLTQIVNIALAEAISEMVDDDTTEISSRTNEQ